MAKPNVSTTAVALTAEYDGLKVAFTEDAWFNATAVSSKYGKRPVDWLRQDDVREYMAALASQLNCEPASLLTTRRGRYDSGTWLHPKLAVKYAQWLDVRFAIWCDLQIDGIMRGKVQAKAISAEYLPGYHEVHDKLHQLAAGSTHERFVHINVNKLVNKAAGIKAGQRDDLPVGSKSLVVVAQMLVNQALAGAEDHHDGYVRAKEALSHLEQAFLPK